MDPNSRILTLADLALAGACSTARKRFAELFGDAVTVTTTLAEQHGGEFDFSYAAEAFLRAPARAEYERIHAPALAEYERIHAPALAEYERIRDAARAEYERILARTFAELYIQES